MTKTLPCCGGPWAGRPAQAGHPPRLCVSPGEAAPRQVLRGAEYSEAVTLDWMRFTVPACSLPDVKALALSLVPGADECRGRFFCSFGLRLGDGSGFYWGSKGGWAVLELSGSFLARFALDERVQLLSRLLRLGCRVTRLDVALDLFNPTASPIRLAADSAARGELCQARRVRVIEEHDVTGNTGAMVTFGTRGHDGSGRFLRVYDKGLEQDQGGGWWFRWEAELADDVATQAAIAIVSARDFTREARSVAVGVVEFREVNGSRYLDDRPFVPWYDQLRAGRGVLFRAARGTPTFERWAGWVTRAVVPSLTTYAQLMSMDLPEFLVWLGAQLQSRPEKERGQVAAELLALRAERRAA